MLIDPGENENSQKYSKKNSNKLFTNLPEKVGIDAPAWTPALVQQYLDETYGVEYSYPSCRRLLKEAGLSYQKPRRTAAESEAEEQEAFREELKKAAGNGRSSSLYRSNQEICPS